MSFVEVLTPTRRIADRLDAMADEIEKRGWTQGSLEGPSGQICLAGAYSQVSGIAERVPDLQYAIFENDAVSRVLKDYLGWCDLIAWNDSRARTQEDVISSLRSCALIERAKEG